MVSIIIPVYNVQAYLRECLDSVLAQTYTDIEVILVDDGSTDKSGIICDEYREKDRRVRVCHKQNAGVSAARNTGIELAGGEYLVFVDSDDCIHPELVEMYMQTVKPDITVLCEYTIDFEQWKKFTEDSSDKKVVHVSRQEFMQLFDEDYINSPVNKIYQAKVIRDHQIVFPEDLDLGEDLLFNLAYLSKAQTSYAILQNPFYYYRDDRTGSLTNTKRRNLLSIQTRLFSAVKKFLTETDIWTENNQRLYYGLYWDRLYLTWRLCEDENNILTDPVWTEVWDECRRRKICTGKRRIKRMVVELRRIAKC